MSQSEFVPFLTKQISEFVLIKYIRIKSDFSNHMENTHVKIIN